MLVEVTHRLLPDYRPYAASISGDMRAEVEIVVAAEDAGFQQLATALHEVRPCHWLAASGCPATARGYRALPWHVSGHSRSTGSNV